MGLFSKTQIFVVAALGSLSYFALAGSAARLPDHFELTIERHPAYDHFTLTVAGAMAEELQKVFGPRFAPAAPGSSERSPLIEEIRCEEKSCEISLSRAEVQGEAELKTLIASLQSARIMDQAEVLSEIRSRIAARPGDLHRVVAPGRELDFSAPALRNEADAVITKMSAASSRQIKKYQRDGLDILALGGGDFELTCEKGRGLARCGITSVASVVTALRNDRNENLTARWNDLRAEAYLLGEEGRLLPAPEAVAGFFVEARDYRRSAESRGEKFDFVSETRELGAQGAAVFRKAEKLHASDDVAAYGPDSFFGIRFSGVLKKQRIAGCRVPVRDFFDVQFLGQDNRPIPAPDAAELRRLSAVSGFAGSAQGDLCGISDLLPVREFARPVRSVAAFSAQAITLRCVLTGRAKAGEGTLSFQHGLKRYQEACGAINESKPAALAAAVAAPGAAANPAAIPVPTPVGSGAPLPVISQPPASRVF